MMLEGNPNNFFPVNKKNSNNITTWTAREIKVLADLYLKGDSIKAIARFLDRSPSAINKALTRFGVRPYKPNLEGGYKQMSEIPPVRPTLRLRFEEHVGLKRYERRPRITPRPLPDFKAFQSHTLQSHLDHSHLDNPHLDNSHNNLPPILSFPSSLPFSISTSSRSSKQRAETLPRVQNNSRKLADSSLWISFSGLIETFKNLFPHVCLKDGQGSYYVNGKPMSKLQILHMVNRLRNERGDPSFLVEGLTW